LLPKLTPEINWRAFAFIILGWRGENGAVHTTGASGGGFGRSVARKPNLLFILADQWRGQALPWTDRDLIAPNLARLAEGGVEFNRAYTCYPAGSPARAAMLTGRYPHTCRVMKNDANCLKTKVTIAMR